MRSHREDFCGNGAKIAEAVGTANDSERRGTPLLSRRALAEYSAAGRRHARQGLQSGDGKMVTCKRGYFRDLRSPILWM